MSNKFGLLKKLKEDGMFTSLWATKENGHYYHITDSEGVFIEGPMHKASLAYLKRSANDYIKLGPSTLGFWS